MACGRGWATQASWADVRSFGVTDLPEMENQALFYLIGLGEWERVGFDHRDGDGLGIDAVKEQDK